MIVFADALQYSGFRRLAGLVQTILWAAWYKASVESVQGGKYKCAGSVEGCSQSNREHHVCLITLPL